MQGIKAELGKCNQTVKSLNIDDYSQSNEDSQRRSNSERTTKTIK